MRILIIGQTTLHWGRMEFGNIGNYYVIEPFFRQVKRVFPDADIYTTLQMSDEFCINENVARLPLELYYSWDDSCYLENTMQEYAIAELYNKTGKLLSITPYIKEVQKADLVIDYSGDIWSDNADFVGDNRFLIGLLKDRVAQLLGKKTVMLSGSPSPFKNHNHSLTKEVYENFDLVTNREALSVKLVEELGFDISKTKSYACPAFLFDPASLDEIQYLITKHGLDDNVHKTGFVLCGWNLLKGPYDRDNVDDNELLLYVEMLEKHILFHKTRVYLFSHSNGFVLPPNFELIRGRDFPFAEQVYKIIQSRRNVPTDSIVLVDDILDARKTKAMISCFDMLISGRIHAAVAALSQAVPTVIVDYGHEPKAHKLKGFADVAGVSEYVADPSVEDELMDKVTMCFNDTNLPLRLGKQMKVIKQMVNESFDCLKEL